MLTAEQQKIYEGLLQIGEALANFYSDGVRMMSPDNTIRSSANMIAHAARELDGGIRDIFAPKEIAKKKEALIPNFKENMKHFPSVLAAVGKDDPQNELANKWYDIARKFHNIAHRKNVHSISADPTEAINLWKEYEKILSAIIGSFLSITNRLDVLLGLDVPQKDSLPALKNILRNPKHASYFFSRLDKTLWLKPMKDEGFFDIPSALLDEEKSEPEYWYPIKYLLNISPHCRRKIKDQLIKLVDDIMNLYIAGKIRMHAYTATDILQILIKVDDLSFGDTERKFFERYSANGNSFSWSIVHSYMTQGLTEKLINKQDLNGLKNLLDYFFGFTTYNEPGIIFFGEDEHTYVRRRPNVEDFFITELLNKHGESIFGLIGKEAIALVIQKLKELVQIGSHNLTHGTPASIERSSQTAYNLDWENLLVYFVRDYAGKLTPNDLEDLVDQMLDSNIQILQRLALHLIRENFSMLGNRWWSFIKSGKTDVPIYIHEPYVLLQEHSKNFTDEQFEEILGWIEIIGIKDESEDIALNKMRNGYRIRRWLTALDPSSEKSKAFLAEKNIFYLEWNSAGMLEHPEFDSFGTSQIGFEYPIDLVAFQKLSVSDQIQFIRTFRPENVFDTSPEGLGEILEAAILSNPELYVFSLHDFIPLHSLYAKHVINAIRSIIRDDKFGEYSFVLDFIERKISSESFALEDEMRFYQKKWLGGSVSDIVETIAKKHNTLNLIGADFDRLIALLLSMINNKEFQDDSEEIQNGYVNHILNSIPGRLYRALIQVTKLWSSSFSKKEDAIRWPVAVKEHFTVLLGRKDTDKDFSIVLGMELPFLVYIDSKWVEENLDKILDEKNARHFDYRFHSIFSGCYTLSFDFYVFLKKHKIFSKAVSYFDNASGSLENLINYGILEWKFWNGDPEAHSIIAEIFDRRNPEQIKKFIDVVSTLKYLSAEDVLYMWKRLTLLVTEIPEISDIRSILLSFFDSMTVLTDEVVNLVIDIIENTLDGRDIYGFLRHLFKICDTDIKAAGAIVLMIYNRKLVTPCFEDELESLVSQLYKNGSKEIANGICIQFSEQGSLALKNTYNQNN